MIMKFETRLERGGINATVVSFYDNTENKKKFLVEETDIAYKFHRVAILAARNYIKAELGEIVQRRRKHTHRIRTK